MTVIKKCYLKGPGLTLAAGAGVEGGAAAGAGGGTGAPINFFNLLNMAGLGVGYSRQADPFLRGSQILDRALRSSTVLASYPNNRLRQFNFLEALIPSGHSHLPVSSRKDNCPLVGWFACWQIGIIITNTRVLLVSY